MGPRGEPGFPGEQGRPGTASDGLKGDAGQYMRICIYLYF